MQLVFGRDAMHPINHQANWTYIHGRKKKIITDDDIRENKKRRDCECQLGQQVWIKQEQSRKFGTDAFKGPAIVTKINNKFIVPHASS